MTSYFAGAVFTQEDTPRLLTILGVISLIVLSLIVMTIWGFLKLIRPVKKDTPPAQSSRILTMIIPAILLFLFVYKLGIISAIFPKHLTRENSSATKTQQTAEVATQDSSVLQPCEGNTQDTCKQTPSADFYPTGSEGASNPAYSFQDSDQYKKIAGRITAHDTTSITLKTSSGRDFRVEYPVDAFNNFNQTRSQSYGFEVVIGDYIFVSYTESPGEFSLTIPASHMFSSGLIMQDSPGQKQTAGLKY